mgnify:CR=1 FL=1
MSNNKAPVYPDMDNMWAAASSGYSTNIIAHNMGIVAASMIEQQKINMRNSDLLKQIDDQMKSIRKSLEEISKRKIVVQR